MSVTTNARCVTSQNRVDIKLVLAGAHSGIGRVYVLNTSVSLYFQKLHFEKQNQ